MSATLLAGGFLAILSAALFAFVGKTIAERPISGEARTASRLFAWWWALLGLSTLMTGALNVLAGFGVAPFFLHEAATDFSILLISGALACLLYYLVYIFTGKSSLLVPIMASYAVYAFVLLTWIQRAGPIDVRLRRWQTELVYERPIEGGVLMGFVILLVGPQLLAAIGYLSLLFRVKGRAPRYRITMVALSIILWFGASLLTSASGLGSSDAWQLGLRFVSVLAALAVLLAYRPPTRIQEWLDAPPRGGGRVGAV